jgi:hypothetical protein
MAGCVDYRLASEPMACACEEQSRLNAVAYAVFRMIWTVFRPVLEPLSHKALMLLRTLSIVFIALMAVYILVRYMLRLP